MLPGMSQDPSKPPSAPLDAASDHKQGQRHTGPALPDHLAGSGALNRLVDRARDYAREAVAENTARAYARGWAGFSRWCRMRGAEPLPASPQLVGLYIADLAGNLSVASIERRLSGLPLQIAALQRPLHILRSRRRIAKPAYEMREETWG